MNIRGKVRATIAAAKAGLIVSRCQKNNILFPCELDDENEEVISCFRHRKEIARLSEISLTNW